MEENEHSHLVEEGNDPSVRDIYDSSCCFRFWLVFFSFASSNVDSAKTLFSTQMKSLLLASVSANTTHIVAFIKNTANQVVEITQAYVNSMLSIIEGGKARIYPSSTGLAMIVGSFEENNTYTVKLHSIFNVVLTFTVTI